MIEKLSYIFTKKEKWFIGLLLIVVIVGSVLELLGVSAFLPFVELLMDPDKIYSEGTQSTLYRVFHFRSYTDFLAGLSVCIIVIYIGKNVYLAIEKNAIYRFSFRLQKRISIRMLVTYMSEPYTFFLNHNIAVLQRSLLEDTDQFAKLVIHVLELISELVVCTILGLYLYAVSKSITVIVVGIMIVTVSVFLVISKKITKPAGKRAQQYKGDIHLWMNQALSGIKEIKVLGRQKFFVDRYGHYFDLFIRDICTTRLIGTIPRYFMEAACISGLLFAVIMKMYFGQKEFSDFIPQLAAFAAAALRLLPSVGKINEHVTDIMYCSASLNLVYNDLKDLEEREAAGKPSADQTENWNLEQEIRVSHIDYHYPDAEENVLEDADLVIPKGQTIALIGASGAGKSTMADIILGLLTPQRGHIYADSMDVFRNVSSWQKQIGYIPQVIYLSDDTIRNNIAFGIPENQIDETAVQNAVEKAQLAEYVATLPDGLDTYVGDRGVRLSGGQRQRIGIARALYHDPEILILDEATSALDQDTETAVMEAVDGLHGMKTMIIIAHRLTTIRNADKIYEIADGKAVLRDKKSVIGS